jgi:hypothetical protein
MTGGMGEGRRREEERRDRRSLARKKFSTTLLRVSKNRVNKKTPKKIITWEGSGECISPFQGLSDTSYSSTPVKIPLPGPVLDLATGGAFNLALLEDGSLFSWGDNSEGQLGGDRLGGTPGRVEILDGKKKPVVGFGCAEEKCYAIFEGGEIVFWGRFTKTPPSLEKNLVHVPFPTSEDSWEKIFRWLFLGKLEKSSEIYILPVEVLFHVTSTVFKEKAF